MNALVGKSNSRAVRAALENLPSSMDGTYDEAMERIAGQGEDDRQLAERVLSWIIYAFRPLSLTELQHALSVSPNTSNIDSEALEDDTIFVSVCAGLVVVDEESHLVRLIHYTAQQYFESQRESLFPNGQAYISQTCLTYLSFDQFRKGYCFDDSELVSLLESNPLLLYTAMYWGHHTRGHVEETHRESVLGFLQKTGNVACASQVLLIDQEYWGYVGFSQRFRKDFSGMHLLSFFGLEKVLHHRLKHGARVDFMDGSDRTPLRYAAKTGHKAVVRLPFDLEHCDARDSYGQTPLSVAAENGHDAVARLLTIRDDVDVNSRDSKGRSSLSYAAGNGHKEIVKLLLARHDIELNCRARGGQTPLSFAAANGHEPVVSLLLAEAGIDVNPKDYNDYSPLSRAASHGHEEVVRVLLAHDDIELNCENMNDSTPLFLAVAGGRERVVRLLLAEAEINVNFQDSDGYSPLGMAAIFGRVKIARLLVARDDIELNCRDQFGRTPLSAAVFYGHEQVAKLIREAGQRLHITLN